MTTAMIDRITDGPLRSPSSPGRIAKRKRYKQRQTCASKVPYTSLTLAQHDAHQWGKTVYQCGVCQCWHLTSHPAPRGRAQHGS